MSLPTTPSPLSSPPLSQSSLAQRSPKSSPSPPPLAESPPYVPLLHPIMEHVAANHSRHTSRPSLQSQISFSLPAAPPKRIFIAGAQTSKKDSRARSRPLSPSRPGRYRHHVSFDNFTDGETTANNIVSYTLNVKHQGHQFKRQSRTFMVGLDEHEYSDDALTWLLNELVDDGDEIVCVQVLDKDDKVLKGPKLPDKGYRQEAQETMEKIQKKSEIDQDRAIGITLEFAVGKLHSTILKMIQLYSPAMLIVGSKGRSLAGFQGLVANRNSFSKWCLQYSPVPVVVVRPPEKRQKKKSKRDADPSRQDYARILRGSGVSSHESRRESKDSSVFEPANPEEIEAQAVAEALGRDVPVTELDVERARKQAQTNSFNATGAGHILEALEKHKQSASSVRTESEAGSGDEYSDESSEEGEFEVTSGSALLRKGGDEGEISPTEEKKKKLHEMEVDEAAALSRSQSRDRADSLGSNKSKDDEGDDEDDGDQTPRP
ncbi:hypothetical protein B0O99DRAFT_95067 [Bisporella sp. PMI_857]|nr:hypothetical protein B0O99DRAFT_95067 [Bisporella sp. PMI_857]